MKEGKIPSELLRSLVFSNIRVKNKDVILRPEIGEDCAAIDFGDYACVLSTDPITGADKGAGTLAVHISCNDVASSGVKPLGLMITIMAPLSTTEEDIRRIMKEAGDAAAELDVEIIGGHTEITSAVNRVVISTTALGKVLKDKIIKTSGAQVGDDVIMTKWAGLEGTSIIVSDREAELKDKLPAEKLEYAKSFINHISVVKEGVIAAEAGAHCMHDVTEGGILGAVWEVAESSDVGIEVDMDSIPIKEVTSELCRILDIDPYRLISSGCMLITAQNGSALVDELYRNGIEAAVIGRIIPEGRFMLRNGQRLELPPPDVDELFNR